MLTQLQLILLTIFAFVTYAMVTDPNVVRFFDLCIKLLKINTERFFWMLRFHPLVTTNPISQWFMMRKYMKQAEKLQKELNK
jgi:hypothetical protein